MVGDILLVTLGARLEVSLEAKEGLEVRMSVEDELNIACRPRSRLASPYRAVIFASVSILQNRRMKASINATLFDCKIGPPIVDISLRFSLTKRSGEIQSTQFKEGEMK